MTSPFTVVVNTSDAYRDCWDPFFSLFARYWPACKAPILLNTERADYRTALVPVTATRIAEGAQRRPTWSECLIGALARVETPLVLYLQEDYFLEAQVDDRAVGDLAGLMLRRPEIGHIGLTPFGSYGPFERTEDPGLWKIGARSRYRISTQAGLWRREVLASYLRPHENGWMFEIFGTRRAARRTDLFLTVSREPGVARIFPYSHAGIVKGQWDRTVPQLFERNGIAMDFSKRGFFVPRARLIEKLRTARKLAADPVGLLRSVVGR